MFTYFCPATNNDKWIAECVFSGKRKGYFIEAGAATGKEKSSCYVLEKELGWTGICVEPHSSFFEILTSNRIDSICENVCLSDTTGKVIFIEGDGDPLSLYESGIEKNLRRFRHNGEEVISKGKAVEKNSITLYDLLKKHNAPRVIDYIAFDMEGSERPVLEVFPFEEYEILAFSIEDHQCIDLLLSKGYKQVKNPFNTEFLFEKYFLHPKIAEKYIEKFGQIIEER